MATRVPSDGEVLEYLAFRYGSEREAQLTWENANQRLVSELAVSAFRLGDPRAPVTGTIIVVLGAPEDMQHVEDFAWGMGVPIEMPDSALRTLARRRAAVDQAKGPDHTTLRHGPGGVHIDSQGRAQRRRAI